MILKQAFLLPLLCLLVACVPQDGKIHGYVEGDFVLVAPAEGGLLKRLAVQKGQKIKAGERLFVLDLVKARTERDAAQASLDRAHAQFNDLIKGERPEETQITTKQKEQVLAMLSNARKEYNRISPLVESGAASQTALDNAKMDLDTSLARLAELDARLKTASMGAREDQIAAAQSAIKIAEQNLIAANKRLLDTAPVAPVTGQIEDTFFRVGEYVPAATPVVSILPPENVKIRFYVPQTLLPRFKHGQPIDIHCDGCPAAIPAKISFISSTAEYTPPVIYSIESRNKMVFMVEARPDKPYEHLHPGLPVDIIPGTQ